jgi:uncharacterized protein YceK
VRRISRRVLSVLLAVCLVGVSGCGSVEKRPTPKDLVKVDFEQIADEGCQPTPGQPQWCCADKTFEEMTELGIRLQEQLHDLSQDIKYYDKKLEYTEDFYQAVLDEWHRKWYIMLPLGVLGGVGLALTIGLAL